MENKNSKIIAIVMLALVGSVFIGSYIVNNYAINEDREMVLINNISTERSASIEDSIGCVVQVEHYRDLELIGKYEKPNDILLRNFGSFIAMMFKGIDADYFSMYDDASGTARSWSGFDNNRMDNAFIYYGTGTTPPSLNDWNLDTETNDDQIMQVEYSVSGSQMNCTYAVSFGITGTEAIEEVGMSWMLYASTYYNFLMARDLLPSTVNVVAGDILTIRYIIMFN